MSTTTFKLKGWHALVALPLVLGYLGYRYYSMQTTVDQAVEDYLRLQLQGEYTGVQLPRLKDAIESRNLAAVRAQVEQVKGMSDIEFRSVEARRGRKDQVYVKVEIEVDGQPPPDGKPVRYYIFTYSMVTGWRYVRESSGSGFRWGWF